MRSGRTGRPTDPSSDPWLHLAVRYLARWDRTAAQVERFLRAKGASSAQTAQTIGRLSDLRYLNDKAFAERWIDSRLARRPMGRERLKVELLATGVSEGEADRAVREALRGVGEEALARRALAAARRKGRRMTLIQMARLLRQRGFEDETIDRMIPIRSQHEGLD